MAAPQPDRRQFLAHSAPALLLAQSGSGSGSGSGSASGSGTGSKGSPEAPPKDGPIQQSPLLPQAKIVLPTDDILREGPAKRLAAIATVYWKYSHADDIITRFIEGYSIFGRSHQPHCKVVSLYLDKTPEDDIGKGMAAHYKIPIFKTAAETLTVGGKELAVDGVLIVAEHGDYPLNEKGQIQYPRKRLFEEVLGGFKALGKTVPVYVDKHLSWSWEQANWMYDQSKKNKFALMAGSSVPLTWRRPALELRFGSKIESALAIGGGDPESSGFHVLEALQCFAERRPGGETGVKAVRCFTGETVWKLAAPPDEPIGKLPPDKLWHSGMLYAALAALPEPPLGRIESIDKEPTLFMIEYTDGFRAACYISPKAVTEYAIALKVAEVPKPVATWFYLPKPQRDHFSFLCNHLEKMFHTDLPSYPVERTLLTTGMLSFLMDSRFEDGKRMPTPALSKLNYRPQGE